MKRTWKTALTLAGPWSTLALIGCGAGGEGLEGQPGTDLGTSGAALTVYEQAAVNTANTSQDCASLGDFYWEVGDAAAKRFGFSRGASVTETTVMPLASASKWLYASAYLQEKGYLNLTAAQKKRLNFTGGFIEGNDLNICGEPGTTVAVCYGPGYKDVSYRLFQDGKFFYDGGHMQKLAVDDMGGRTGTGFASVTDWLNNQLGTGFPESASAVAVAGGFRGSAAHYRLFLQNLLNSQYTMSVRLNADDVPAYPGGANVTYTPWRGDLPVHYGLGHWIEREPVNGAITVTGHSSPGKFGFYPWVNASRSQYMLLARARNDSATFEGQMSRECAHRIRVAYSTGVTQR